MSYKLPLPLCLVFVACNGVTGVNGAQGTKGDQGPAGPPGPTGPSGAPGADCDTTTCPSATTVDGLAGGSISGTTTLSAAVAGDLTLAKGTAASPKGVIVERGAGKTSIGGFYCGVTSFNVFGTYDDATGTNTYGGLQGVFRVAKKHCENKCGNAAAHACRTTEIQLWQELGGGSSTTGNAAWRNPDVPMPPNGEYWVNGSDIVSNCINGASEGLTYTLVGEEGVVTKESCANQHPLLCCL